MSGEVETAKDLENGDPADVAKRWLKEIELADQHEKKWRERADKIIELYRDEKERAEDSATSRFNILFANTEVLKGALYSRVPVPDCRRRFLDKDPVGRVGAQVLQRGLSYSVDAYDFNGTMKDAVSDMVLPGRGQARVRYIPTISEGQVIYEEVRCDYVEWDMFRYSPAKRWSKVRWVAFGELLTREDLVSQFGETIGNAVLLNWMPKGKEDTKDNELFKRALVWTIWNKSDRKVYVVSSGYKAGPIKETADPLKLDQFFPCPEPIYDIRTTGSLIPIPEYAIYQDQAIQLEELTNRIAILTDALRRRGVYDKSIPELLNLAKAADNEFIGVDEYAKLNEKGGLIAAFQELPIDGLAKVLVELMEQSEKKKAEIYELIGLSDIMRGTTKAAETLGAQQLKSQYGEIRIGPRQADIARFARDIMRLKAEIISEHFQPQTLAMMTGIDLFMTKADKEQAMAAAQQPQPGMPPPDVEKLQRPTWEEVMSVLKSDKLRGFRIDIETDSTIKPQADEEQKNRIELLTAVSSFLEKAIPAVQGGMMPQKVATELMMFGVRAFKTGPQLEEVLDEWAEQAQKPQPQKPDPEAIAQQHEAKLAEQQQAHDQQLAQAKQQHEQQVAQRDQQMERDKAMAEEQRQRAVEMAKHQRELDKQAADDRNASLKADYEARIRLIEIAREEAFERWKVEKEVDGKIAVAQISAKATEAKNLQQAEEHANAGV